MTRLISLLITLTVVVSLVYEVNAVLVISVIHLIIVKAALYAVKQTVRSQLL